MDSIIILIAVTFLAFIGAAAYVFLKDSQGKDKSVTKDEGADLIGQYQKKIVSYEERIKKLEYSLAAMEQELIKTKESETALQAKEKDLLKEKSHIAFDSEQYEKFKKDFEALKTEMPHKEEALEKEISLRRKQESELKTSQLDCETLKKRVTESEDAYRKSQAAIEALTKELNLAKKTIDEQKKMVREYTENKMGGEWVSRMEFEKVEKELREKEALIQKFLSHKPDTPSPPSGPPIAE